MILIIDIGNRLKNTQLVVGTVYKSFREHLEGTSRHTVPRWTFMAERRITVVKWAKNCTFNSDKKPTSGIAESGSITVLLMKDLQARILVDLNAQRLSTD